MTDKVTTYEKYKFLPDYTRNLQEDRHLHACRGEDLKSRPVIYGIQSYKKKLILDIA
jgi:hypothetical protein